MTATAAEEAAAIAGGSDVVNMKERVMFNRY
jgi:hypothetical protein